MYLKYEDEFKVSLIVKKILNNKKKLIDKIGSIVSMWFL